MVKMRLTTMEGNMRVFKNFDEIKAAVGTEVGVSEWVEVTQERIEQFAQATGETGGTMAVFYIGTYDIVDPEQFKKYPPLVMALLPKYGGVILASDTQAFVVEGTGRTMNAVIRFPSKEAALALYNDPDYQEAKRIRQASTKNISMVLAEEIQGGS